MIVGPFVDKIIVSYGRPDITPETRQKWKIFHDLVKDTIIPIAVNTMFYKMEEYCNSDQCYMGGGMMYCFWFESEEDLTNFQYELEEKWELYGIR